MICKSLGVGLTTREGLAAKPARDPLGRKTEPLGEVSVIPI